MQRVGILNGKNITYDKDLSQYFLSVANSGVISGLEVQNNKVLTGKAIIKVTRSNGEEIAVVFELTEDLVIDTSGDKKVYIKINQANIDDGSNNSEDGTGIGEIKTGTSYPNANYLALASIVGGTIADVRNFVKLNGRKGIEVLDTLEIQKQDGTLGNIKGKKVKIEDLELFKNQYGEIETTSTITADKFKGDGSLLTNLISNPFIFGDGSDGDLVVNDGEVYNLEVDRIYNFSSITVNSGGKISSNENGNFYIKCKGTLQLDGNIDLRGKAGNYTSITEQFFGITKNAGTSNFIGGKGGDRNSRSGGAGSTDGYGGGGAGGSAYAYNGVHRYGGNGGAGGTPGGLGGAGADGIGGDGADAYSKRGGDGQNFSGSNSANGSDGGTSAGGGGAVDKASSGSAHCSGGGGGSGGKPGTSAGNLVILANIIKGNGNILLNGTDGTPGGDGGNSYSSYWGNHVEGGAGGGGGAGGNGGALICIYGEKNDNFSYNTAGGNGGDGGNPGGEAGSNGGDGENYVKSIYDLI